MEFYLFYLITENYTVSYKWNWPVYSLGGGEEKALLNDILGNLRAKYNDCLASSWICFSHVSKKVTENKVTNSYFKVYRNTLLSHIKHDQNPITSN